MIKKKHYEGGRWWEKVAKVIKKKGQMNCKNIVCPTCIHVFMSCVCVEMNVHIYDHSLEEFMSYATTS
jgi:hypothetical protein